MERSHGVHSGGVDCSGSRPHGQGLRRLLPVPRQSDCAPDASSQAGLTLSVVQQVLSHPLLHSDCLRMRERVRRRENPEEHDAGHGGGRVRGDSDHADFGVPKEERRGNKEEKEDVTTIILRGKTDLRNQTLGFCTVQRWWDQAFSGCY